MGSTYTTRRTNCKTMKLKSAKPHTTLNSNKTKINPILPRLYISQLTLTKVLGNFYQIKRITIDEPSRIQIEKSHNSSRWNFGQVVDSLLQWCKAHVYFQLYLYHVNNNGIVYEWYHGLIMNSVQEVWKTNMWKWMKGHVHLIFKTMVKRSFLHF